MTSQRFIAATFLVSLSWVFPAHGSPNNSVREPITDNAERLSASNVIGSVTQQDRVADGRWVTSDVTLRDDGTLLGQTNLSNSNSVFGFTAEVVVALVDANKKPLAYEVIGSWGLNACFFSCPVTRGINWTLHVAEWERIRDDVRGLAVIQRHNPSNRFWDWLWTNRNEVVSLVGVLAKLF